MQSLLKLAREPFYRNSASIVGNMFFYTFYGLTFWIVAARLVSTDVIGLAVATISTATFLTSLSRLGMDDVLVRFLPGSQDRSALYGSVLVITALLSLLFTGIFLCLVDYISPALSYLRDGWYLLLFAFYMVTVSLYTTQNTTLLAARRADKSLVQNSLLGFRIPVVFLLASMGAIGIFLSFNLAYVAALALGMVYLLRQGIRPKIDCASVVSGPIKGYLRYSAGNYLSTIFTMMPSTLMPVIIMNVTGTENVAYFYMAYSIAALLFIIPNAVAMSLFVEGSHDMPLDEYAGKAIRLILALVVPLAIVLFFTGDRLLLLFSREYSEQSIGLLKLLVISSPFSAVISVFAAVRRVEKNVRSLYLVSAASTALLLGLGYVFLSISGLTGLGYAWVAANAAVSLTLVAVLLKEGKLFRARGK